jgi:phosphoenolpyruvate carboxykinase (ATP)
MYRNLSTKQLIEHVINNKEGILSTTGAVVVETGKYTGRSPKDKFIVKNSFADGVDWEETNQPFEEENYKNLYKKMMKYIEKKDLYQFDGFAGADENYKLPIRVITEFAWHSLFSKHLFIEGNDEIIKTQQPEFTVIDIPSFKADPLIDHTNSETFIIINFKEKLVLIGGTEYAGEIKKSIFSVLNYLLPFKNVLPMHCSANIDEKGEVALFFGLSGTGKTTLSTDPNRYLIGDDEHGWSDNGVFNFEGGCYAKTIHLSKEKEPEIYNAIKNGAVLENVITDEKGIANYEDNSLTENTRAAYSLNYLENIKIPSIGGHPKTILFLTADAFGVLPPISKLTKEQAIYYFLNGYTSKLAGTERGITAPEATFSTCFGKPFLPLKPYTYAKLLEQKITLHESQIYLVNTGWIGGGYGKGERISLKYTRKMVNAAINGELNKSKFQKDQIFNLDIPVNVEGVPAEILLPENTWKDKNSYIEEARKLKELFDRNFKNYKEMQS